MDGKKSSGFLSNILFLALLITVGYLLFNFAFNGKYKGSVIPFSNTFHSKSGNILLLGADPSNNLTDSIMLVNYNSDKHRISVLSIPRDTRIISDGSPHKINSIYTIYGKGNRGATNSKGYVSKLLSLKVDDYAVINTSSFRKIIDILGGIDYSVPCDLKYKDSSQNLYIDLKKGFQHLDGNKAEQLLRFRKPQNGDYSKIKDCYDGSDLKRINVQQSFFKELVHQKAKLSNITDLKPIVSEIYKNIETSLSIPDTLNLIIDVTQNQDFIKPENIKVFQLDGTVQTIEGSSYFIFNDKILDNSVSRPASEVIDTFFSN